MPTLSLVPLKKTENIFSRKIAAEKEVFEEQEILEFAYHPYLEDFFQNSGFNNPSSFWALKIVVGKHVTVENCSLSKRKTSCLKL